MKEETLPLESSGAPVNAEAVVCASVDKILRDPDLVDDKPSGPILTIAPLDELLHKDIPELGSTFRCVMNKIPIDSCRSPFRCQQKLRALRKTLRKTSHQVICATGLELAASHFCGALKLSALAEGVLQKSFESRTFSADIPANLPVTSLDGSKATISRNGIEKFFYSSVFLPTISHGGDWCVETRCVFCITGSNWEDGNLLSNRNLSVPLTNQQKPQLEVKDSTQIDSSSHLLEQGSLVANHHKKSVKLKTTQRKYSAAELSAAIIEVERGRVGTRKAAILYGIPRSTLRNKVGKLATQKTTSSQAIVGKAPVRGRAAVGGLKRAASADLTSALKEIISRHITAKSKAEESAEGEKDGSNLLRYKRGRYRRYDKDDLDEALKAVESGLMTVHRAGHFFGIPHSTLEYKIKERNIVTKNLGTGPAEDKHSSDTSSPDTSGTTPYIKTNLEGPQDGETMGSVGLPVAKSAPGAGHMNFTWPGESLYPPIDFGLGPFFIPNPICDLFAGFRASQTSFTSRPINTRMTLPLSLYTFHPGESSFAAPFRPWVRGPSVDLPHQGSNGNDISSVDDPTPGQKATDEPLDLMKKNAVPIDSTPNDD